MPEPLADRSGAGARVDTDSLRDRIDRDGRLMLAAAERAGWDAPVPGLEWDVRTVVAHTAAVHRWAADIVGRALPTNETGGSAAFLEGMSDARLPTWADEARVLLIRSLAEAPADLRCYTFTTADPARHFWTRRQAHETAVHRMDVEAAAGPVTPVDAEFAQDGLAELVGGFATETAFASAGAGRLLMDAVDGHSWLVRFGGVRNVVTVDPPVGTPVDATVRGTSDELYRWAWNRPVSEMQQQGSQRVLDQWRAVRIA